MKFESNWLSGLEEKMFENVDGRTKDGRTPESLVYYQLTHEPSAQVS